MIKIARLLPALLIAAALPLSACQKSSDDAFGQRVRGYLLAHPEVLDEMVAKLQEKKRADAAKLAQAAIRAHAKDLFADSRDFVANPNGKVTVVEFFDYRCGFCKASAPTVLKLIQDNPDVRFVFKEFPIFGGESITAAKAALTPAGKAKGLALYAGFMGEKALDEAAIDRHLAAVGLDAAATKRAGDDAAIEKQIDDTRALAQALNLEGTPAFVIGDRLIPGADMAALQAAVTDAKAGKLKTPA